MYPQTENTAIAVFITLMHIMVNDVLDNVYIINRSALHESGNKAEKVS